MYIKFDSKHLNEQQLQCLYSKWHEGGMAGYQVGGYAIWWVGWWAARHAKGRKVGMSNIKMALIYKLY